MKTIRATVEKGPNYVFHLLAVARVGFDSDYADRYRGTVDEAGLAVLEANRGRLTFRDGLAGELVEPAIFMSAYLGLDTPQGFLEYFALVDQAMGGDPAPFLERYREPLQRRQAWVWPMDAAYFAAVKAAGAALEPGRAAFRDLAGVFARNLPAYERDVWPEVRPGLEAVAGRINGFFRDKDVIGSWEDLTGLSFKFDHYDIVLVEAIKNGPSANSLGYERNVFYAGADWAYYTQFCSHEVGTHLLIDLMGAYGQPDAAGKVRLPGGGPAVDYSLVYRAYENLCRFYNSLVLGTTALYGMGDDYAADEFFAIYRDIWSAGGGPPAAEMLRRSLERFALQP